MLKSIYIVVGVVGVACGAFQPASVAGSSKLAAAALKTQTEYASTVRKAESCENPVARREWMDLSVDERKQWVAAVNCLMDRPTKLGSRAPGAKSRYDDFLATHMNQTLHIHYTGNFLHWHRYFVATFEKALQEECNYQGVQPYADWGKYVHDPIDSPLFDGSESSIGSNGIFVPRTTVLTIPPWARPQDFQLNVPLNLLGGGCIAKGPFADRTVHLGPSQPTYTDPVPNPRSDGLGYNPRCIKRELSSFIAEKMIDDRNATDLLTKFENIGPFQDFMEDGVHTGGHSLVNAAPGSNLFTSPGDPHFWLHHGYIDRLWWIWQNTKPADRQFVVAGTRTFQNNPPSADTTLDDMIDIGVNAGPRTLRSVTSTLEQGLCYNYR